MILHERIEAGALLIPVRYPEVEQIVVVRAYGRYRKATVLGFGPRFVRVGFRLKPSGPVTDRCYPPRLLYLIAPDLPLGELTKLGGVRVYETVTNLAYDKTRKGPQRVVKLQVV